MSRLTLSVFFLCLHNERFVSNDIIATNHQITNDGIVIPECRRQLFHRFVRGFDIHKNIVGFVNFIDVVGQLTSAPIFKTMHLPAIFGDDVGISLNHTWNLFRLVGMDHEHNFVVSHSRTPLGLVSPNNNVWCDKEMTLYGPASYKVGEAYSRIAGFAMVNYRLKNAPTRDHSITRIGAGAESQTNKHPLPLRHLDWKRCPPWVTLPDNHSALRSIVAFRPPQRP